ncbi:RNA-directed DNA polymerase (Reverse transcriptase) [Melia azedarach]|uniref:RNA-directed DNA polymerase (Reverse transcriptase) n=1 Tax=Melia azedarach TaxID=155640 RepID=A0ACC1XG11_MELAZ|nr:RNA-directed DNA polymerase (Reverse transcriptase) [Melia azedarach]
MDVDKDNGSERNVAPAQSPLIELRTSPEAPALVEVRKEPFTSKKPLDDNNDFAAIAITAEKKCSKNELPPKTVQSANKSINSTPNAPDGDMDSVSGWRSRGQTELRLDRALCNSIWLDCWPITTVSALPRNSSDHSPLVFSALVSLNSGPKPFRFQSVWLNHISFLSLVQESWQAPTHLNCPMENFSYKLRRLKYKLRVWNKDCFGDVNKNLAEANSSLADVQNRISVYGISDSLFQEETNAKAKLNEYLSTFQDIIPKLVTDEDNLALTAIPDSSEIKEAVFSLDSDSAPGPDGFSGCFYKNCWDIISYDLADSITQFRPIALANFIFKIILKIMADRLKGVVERIISPQQHAFIRGRSISDAIALVSENFQLLNRRIKGGNVGIKLDIAKAFDTMDWSFLLQVLARFGFDDCFIYWVSVILHSAKLSILVNGTPHGFFSCNRGVRQGDPLSPILFCIAEDYLSRGLTKVLETENIKAISKVRGSQPISHVLYADDAFLFCRGDAHSLENLKHFLQHYEFVSGQKIS